MRDYGRGCDEGGGFGYEGLGRGGASGWVAIGAGSWWRWRICWWRKGVGGVVVMVGKF